MLEISFDPFPALTTERMELRQLSTTDVKDVLALRSDPRTMRWIPRPIAKTEDDAMDVIDLINRRIASAEGINWAMALKETGRVVGIIGFVRMQPENYRAEVGYQLAYEHHRKGLMQEALQTVVEFGFRDMKLHSIEAVISPDNIPSQQLIEKAGFVREAHFRQNQFYHGKFQDSLVYSLLTPEASIAG